MDRRSVCTVRRGWDRRRTKERQIEIQTVIRGTHCRCHRRGRCRTGCMTKPSLHSPTSCLSDGGGAQSETFLAPGYRFANGWWMRTLCTICFRMLRALVSCRQRGGSYARITSQHCTNVSPIQQRRSATLRRPLAAAELGNAEFKMLDAKNRQTSRTC